MAKTKFCTGCRALLLAPIIFSFNPLLGQSEFNETVSVIEQWVDVERKISSEKAKWESDKASMENLIELFKQEKILLEEQLDEAESFTSEAENKRLEYAERNEAIKALENEVLESIIASEKSLKTLLPLLPKPLQEELSPLFNSLPDNPEKSKAAIGSRIQPVVAILTQIQKFDQVDTIVEGFQEFEAGRTVQTETIYFGLGAAYYVDKANDHAGIGVLTENGWEWEIQDDLAPQLRNFVEIYRGSKQAEYIQLPVQFN